MNKKFLAILLASTVLSVGVVQAEPKIMETEDYPKIIKLEKVDKIRRFDKKHHQKMAERMAKDLGLTAEQRKKAEELRKKSQEKIKPLIDEMKDLRERIDAERKANMEEFEKILTPEQKEKFDEIKTRGSEEFKRRHKEMQEIMMGKHSKEDLLPHEREHKFSKRENAKGRKELKSKPKKIREYQAKYKGETLPPPPPPAE